MIGSMIILLLVVTFLLWRGYSRNKETIKLDNAVDPSINKFRAIQVVPCDEACNAAIRNSKKTFLETELKGFPLEQCDHIAQCMCKFRHLDDRRQSEERRASSALLQSVFGGEERRGLLKKGRRKNDRPIMSYS